MHNKELRVQPAVEGTNTKPGKISNHTRLLLSLAAGLCLLLCAAISSASAQTSELEFVPGQVVVKLSSVADLP